MQVDTDQRAVFLPAGDIVIKMGGLRYLNGSNSTAGELFRPELGGIVANLEISHQHHCLAPIDPIPCIHTEGPRQS